MKLNVNIDGIIIVSKNTIRGVRLTFMGTLLAAAEGYKKSYMEETNREEELTNKER